MNYFELIHLTNQNNIKEYWDCKGNKISKKEFDRLKQINERAQGDRSLGACIEFSARL